MTITRRVWRGEYVPGQQTPHVKEAEAFGWKVHRHVLPVGTSMIVLSQRTIDRVEAPNIALYVRGRASVTNDSSGTYPDRIPGLFTGERPEHPQGKTTITAIEELEFWCFNWHANRRALPQLTPVCLPDGGEIEVELGQRVLVCRGELAGHEVEQSFKAQQTTLVGAENTYALLIGGDRV